MFGVDVMFLFYVYNKWTDGLAIVWYGSIFKHALQVILRITHAEVQTNTATSYIIDAINRWQTTDRNDYIPHCALGG